MYFSTKPDLCAPSSFHSVWTHKHFAVEMALCSIWSLSQTHWVWNIIWCLCIVMPFWNLKYSEFWNTAGAKRSLVGDCGPTDAAAVYFSDVFRMHHLQPLATSLRTAERKSGLCWLLAGGSPVMLIEPKDKVGKNRRLLPPAVFPECSFPARTTRLAMMAKTRGDLWAEDKMNKWCAFQTPGRLI